MFTLWISYTKPRPGVICKWINGCYLSLHTDALQCLPLLKLYIIKGADLFLKGGQTKKQAGGRGTSRYSIGIKS